MLRESKNALGESPYESLMVHGIPSFLEEICTVFKIYDVGSNQLKLSIPDSLLNRQLRLSLKTNSEILLTVERTIQGAIVQVYTHSTLVVEGRPRLQSQRNSISDALVAPINSPNKVAMSSNSGLNLI